jgi:hypothetical protein
MVVFIKTHGRPDKIYTLKALRDAGYTGLIILVTDNEDKSNYVSMIDHLHDGMLWHHVFNKQKMVDIIDSGVSNPNRNVNLYAWAACEKYAHENNYTHYIMADDDITGFRYRYEEDGHLKSLPITKNLDAIFEAYFEWMDKGVCATSFADVRMFIGGQIHESRGVYNIVFRNVKYDMLWKSNMYEETSTAIDTAKTGNYIYQLPFIQFSMKGIDKKVDGGMKGIYDELSIYKRACFPLIFNPSCIEIANNNVGFKLKFDKAFPKLISSDFKKL